MTTTALAKVTQADLLRSAYERRQHAITRLEGMSPEDRPSDYETARRQYNAATTALDELQAKAFEVGRNP